jgi:hypothetical protein
MLCSCGSFLKFREFLFKLGLIHPRPGFDAKKLVCTLLLESCCCSIHYTGQNKDRVATFDFYDFPIIDNNKNVVHVKQLTVDVDLDMKEMVTATLDDRVLTPDDTACLVWFTSITADHVKLHSLANWARPKTTKTTPSSSMSFHMWMSDISVLYNYFGASVFPRLCHLWYSLGLISIDMSSTISKVFEIGCNAGIDHHANITDLMEESSVVKFVVKLHGKFLRHFKKHSRLHPEDFEGVDAESLFVSTALHSLNHTLMEWNMKDPLWLD